MQFLADQGGALPSGFRSNLENLPSKPSTLRNLAFILLNSSLKCYTAAFKFACFRGGCLSTMPTTIKTTKSPHHLHECSFLKTVQPYDLR